MRTIAFGLAALLATPTLAETITIDDIQRGTIVTVSGTVERLLDEDEFRLTDATGSIRVYVGPNWVPADVGEEITVHGFVDDDLIKEIYAREITRADGTVVALSHRYY
ncbi:MAG: hypothetical protein ACPGID_08160 [Rubricella sp.]